MNDSLGHIFIDALLINNFVLCVFLGMCSFLGLSQKFSTAWRMGVSVMFVITVSGVLSYGAHLLLVAFHVASHTTRLDFPIAGRMDSAAVRAGEWWRIFTAMLLHADSAHLASNVFFGMLFLGLAMGRYGSGLGLLAAYLAGAAGNVAGLIFYPEPHFGVGASGMVMGGLGMLAAQSITLLRRGFVGRKQALGGIMAGVMLFVLFGLSPGTDVLAHFAGFVTGLALGGILLLFPSAWRNGRVDFAAAILLVGLLVFTSWLAFH